MPATAKAQKNERVACTTYPVTIGAAIPASWLPKFRIPPSVPTLSFGAIKEGIDQPTGDAADNPPIHRLIQISALVVVCACAAPKNSESQRSTSDKNRLPHANRISASLDQCI